MKAEVIMSLVRETKNTIRYDNMDSEVVNALYVNKTAQQSLGGKIPTKIKLTIEAAED